MPMVVASGPHDRQEVAPGIAKQVLWRGGDGVAFERFSIAAGTPYAEHGHRGWEMMFVLSGRIDMGGGIICGPGDFLFTRAGESHAPVVLEDAELLFGFDQRHKERG